MKNQHHKDSLLKAKLSLRGLSNPVVSAFSAGGAILLAIASIGTPSYSVAQAIGNPLGAATARFCTLSYSDNSVAAKKVPCTGPTATTDVVCPLPGKEVDLILTQTDEFNFDSMKRFTYKTPVDGFVGIGGGCSPGNTGGVRPNTNGSCPASGRSFTANFTNDVVSVYKFSSSSNYRAIDFDPDVDVFPQSPEVSNSKYLADLKNGVRMSAISFNGPFYTFNYNQGLPYSLATLSPLGITTILQSPKHITNEYFLVSHMESYYYGSLVANWSRKFSLCRPMQSTKIKFELYGPEISSGVKFSILDSNGIKTPLPLGDIQTGTITLPGAVSGFEIVKDVNVKSNIVFKIFEISGTAL